MLYRMAHYVLEPSDVEALQRDYSNPDNPRIRAAVLANYEAVAARLAPEAAPATV